jgi:hypothetical protein
MLFGRPAEMAISQTALTFPHRAAVNANMSSGFSADFSSFFVLKTEHNIFFIRQGIYP